MNKTFSHSFESKSLSAQHTPGDEHLFLDVSQKLRVILAGQIQTLSMETQDLQTVQHVEQDVRLLKLRHFLNTDKMCDSRVDHNQVNHRTYFLMALFFSVLLYLQNGVYEL